MQIQMVYAGHYWTDAGAFMGVLPYSIWSKKIKTDERRRLCSHLNLLLIRISNRNILVDTGLGNRLSDRQKDIYNPSDFLLLESLQKIGLHPDDITDVILTHLHFDHAGGITINIGGEDKLTFSNAVHWIQADEWDIAKHPNELNKAAYQFEHQLSLLAKNGKIHLIDHKYELLPCLKLIWVGGHTVGTQIVEIHLDNKIYIYAGDIIPTKFHLPLPVTSAYDISRQQTFIAKQMIYNKLKANNGILLLDHDTQHWEIPAEDILF